MERRYGEVKEVVEAERDTAAAGRRRQSSNVSIKVAAAVGGFGAAGAPPGFCSTTGLPGSEETSGPDGQSTRTLFFLER